MVMAFDLQHMDMPATPAGPLQVNVRTAGTDRTVTLNVTAETTFADMVTALTQQGLNVNAFVFRSKVWPLDNQLGQARVQQGGLPGNDLPGRAAAAL